MPIDDKGGQGGQCPPTRCAPRHPVHNSVKSSSVGVTIEKACVSAWISSVDYTSVLYNGSVQPFLSASVNRADWPRFFITGLLNG